MAIAAWGTYLPAHRLDRTLIGTALGSFAGRGTRAVAGYDEDTTSMGVAAARNALAGLPADLLPQRLLFATANPAYLDKTNATAVHAALGLPASVAAYDVGGSTRSGIGALRLAADAAVPTLVIMSDLRTGLPGSTDEREGGDGAVALVVGSTAAIGDAAQTRVLGAASASLEFLDRWRLPGERSSHVWEERFGEHAYVPLVAATFADALATAGIGAEALDHVVVTGVHSRAVRVAARAIGVAPDRIVDDLADTVGNTGAAHPGLLLAGLLERMAPGRRLALVVVADGCDVVIAETTGALGAVRPRRTLAEQIAGTRPLTSYETFLTWRGHLDREPPRRANCAARPAITPESASPLPPVASAGSTASQVQSRWPSLTTVRAPLSTTTQPRRLAMPLAAAWRASGSNGSRPSPSAAASRANSPGCGVSTEGARRSRWKSTLAASALSASASTISGTSTMAARRRTTCCTAKP